MGAGAGGAMSATAAAVLAVLWSPLKSSLLALGFHLAPSLSELCFELMTSQMCHSEMLLLTGLFPQQHAWVFGQGCIVIA